MPKTICLFNHKGGVSKTTTSFNVGWGLAKRGKRVLLVDLDSQCNLTGLVFGMDALDDDIMESYYDKKGVITIREIVDDIINGLDLTEKSIENLKLKSTKNDNLFLLPGHLDISELDSQISVSLKVSQGIPVARNIPAKLPKILNAIAKNKSIDYIIYDLNPGIGGLNQVALMSSDYFIVPTSPDYFCLQSIISLSKNIPKWHAEIENFKIINKFGGDFPITNKPCFLGSVQQRYRIKNANATKSFEKWIDRIREEVYNRLVPELEKINCVVDKAVFEDILKDSGLKPYDLAHISDFNTLIAISQQLSTPIYDITDEELASTGKLYGHALTTLKESRDSFKNIFGELVDRILLLTK